MRYILAIAFLAPFHSTEMFVNGTAGTNPLFRSLRYIRSIPRGKKERCPRHSFKDSENRRVRVET